MEPLDPPATPVELMWATILFVLFLGVFGILLYYSGIAILQSFRNSPPEDTDHDDRQVPHG